MVVYKKQLEIPLMMGLWEAETCRVKIKEINTQNKQLHPLVTLLQYVQKMHGTNNRKKIVASCWLFSWLYHDARIHERQGKDAITSEPLTFHLLARMWISRLLPLTLHWVYSSTHRYISAVCYNTTKQQATEIQQAEQNCATENLCVFALKMRVAHNIYSPLQLWIDPALHCIALFTRIMSLFNNGKKIHISQR